MREEVERLTKEKEEVAADVRRRVEQEEREARMEDERRREVERLEKAKWEMKVGEAEEDRDKWKREAAHQKEKLRMVEKEKSNKAEMGKQERDEDERAAVRCKRLQTELEEWKAKVEAAEDEKRGLQRRVNVLLVGKSAEEREGWMVREAAEERDRANAEMGRRLVNGSRQRQELEAIIECQSWLVETLVLSQEEERRKAEQLASSARQTVNSHHSSGGGVWKKEAEEQKEQRDEQHQQQQQHQHGGEDKIEDDESAARIRRREEQKQKRDSFLASNHLTIAHYSQQQDRQNMPHYDDVFVDTPQPEEGTPTTARGGAATNPDRRAATTTSKHARVQSVAVRSASKSEWLSPHSTAAGHTRSASAVGGSYTKPTFSSAHREHSIARRKQLMFGSTMPVGAAESFVEHKSPTIEEEEGDVSFFS